MNFAIAALIGSAAAYQTMTSSEYEFMNYIASHGKSYGTKEEYEFRLGQFAKNLKEVERLNATQKYSTHGVNQFTDRTPEEMKKINGYLADKDVAEDFEEEPESDGLDPIDWRDLGAVTDVKDQGQCGSCWTFSATGAIEGSEFVAGNDLPILSEQQFVDCAHFPNMGCNGGVMGLALGYAKRHQVEAEVDYPYEAVNGKCRFKKSKTVTNIKKKKCAKKSFKGLKTNLKKYGPTSISVAASETYFHGYTGGILTDPKECGLQLDHGVLAVGWGNDSEAGDYFIVKNSWTTGWGEAGYVRLGAQGKHGVCGFVKQHPHNVISKKN